MNKINNELNANERINQYLERHSKSLELAKRGLQC